MTHRCLDADKCPIDRLVIDLARALGLTETEIRQKYGIKDGAS